MGAEASASAAGCPDEAAAAMEAERAFKLRRGEFLAEAADAFAAAYRCMPPDRKHEERWEHLASYLETVQRLPAATPAAAHVQLCRARALIADYQQSIRTASPAPETANYAAAEHQRIDEELARQAPGEGACDEGSAAPGPAAPKPSVPAPSTSSEPPGPETAAEPRIDPVARRGAPARPLWIAGAATGAASVIPLVIMGIGLRKGGQAETDAAQAMTTGELQQIRDDIHPNGVLGNRLAYAGAIVGGALFITSVALLTVAGRRARLGRARVTAAGSGLLVRF